MMQLIMEMLESSVLDLLASVVQRRVWGRGELGTVLHRGYWLSVPRNYHTLFCPTTLCQLTVTLSSISLTKT